MELIDLVNCYKNHVISNHRTQMANFPTGIPDCGSHSPALLDLFLSTDTSIYLFYNDFPLIGKF